MAHIEFTPQLHRFVNTPVLDTPATTLRELLDAAFDGNPNATNTPYQCTVRGPRWNAIFCTGDRTLPGIQRGGKPWNAFALTSPVTPAKRPRLLEHLPAGSA